ncbi:MAG: L-threonylcarbamoyladenylate synthase [Phycisphaerae bacterium]|nr:L-threonylcarbamoyladenylate synthase [Phycisphaerae bacterium]MDW8262531.1 L-threonylcarbamoyladenylate synthase [Phycisphaerales bacterium]
MIEQAVQILRGGGLVAFPTETVYGLGADATSEAAVQRVFLVKGRPATNPLIVHVYSSSIARRYVADWPPQAERLAQRFWPGPLTLVLPRRPSIADAVTAGLPTVAVRVPDHPMALSLLRAFDGPVAAPSANRSTRLSPTTAQHVREELGESVDLILDGGPCQVGIESTVIDLTSAPPRVLRPGRVTVEALRAEIGDVEAPRLVADPSRPATSPGQQQRHYAPTTPAFRFEPHERPLLDLTAAVVVEPSLDPETYARQLYARLRMLDSQGLRAIFIEMPPDRPEWTAVRDRIVRATRPWRPVEP